MRPSWIAAGVAVALTAAVAAAQPLLPQGVHDAVGHVDTPPQFLVRHRPTGTLVDRGRTLVVAGDCIACHTPGGRPAFSGGRGLNTPFGVIYSSNLTSDRQTGIGDWDAGAFWRAMHEGKGRHGENLYPAFPYTNFTGLSRADSDAILAYLKTVPPVHATPPANGLPFPLNIRLAVSGWNLLNFRPGAWTPDPSHDAAWNRGSYLVATVGHCGACHTAKNLLSGDKRDAYLQGARLDGWHAPNLTGSSRTGLGSWSEDDIVEYLRTGRSARANAGGAMAEVVSDSTSLMDEGDRRAIAHYLKGVPAAPEAASPVPDAQAMRAGEAIYVDACTGCHRRQGQGDGLMFPPLKGSAGLQARDPTNAIRVILEGARSAPSPTRVTPISMPSFAWKLSDQQVADVTTYIRNAWGNAASPAKTRDVTTARKALRFATSEPKPQG